MAVSDTSKNDSKPNSGKYYIFNMIIKNNSC